MSTEITPIAGDTINVTIETVDPNVAAMAHTAQQAANLAVISENAALTAAQQAQASQTSASSSASTASSAASTAEAARGVAVSARDTATGAATTASTAATTATTKASEAAASAVTASNAATNAVASTAQLKAGQAKQALPLSIISSVDGQYLNQSGTGNVSADYRIDTYSVKEGDILFIEGQLTAPVDPSPLTSIGVYGLYATTSLGSLLSGSLFLQAEGTTSNYLQIVQVPATAIYLRVSVKKGVDTVSVKKVAELAPLFDRFPDLIELNGGSITWGSAPEDNITWAMRLQTLFGQSTKIVNCGVGGESLWQISARQGGVPMVNLNDFILPALATDSVEVGRYTNYVYNGFFKSSLNRTSNAALLGQGETGRNETFKTVNPVFVDGIECTLAFTKTSDSPFEGTYSLKRNVSAESPRTIYAGTPVITNLARVLKPKASVMWMGTNEGFTGNIVNVPVLIDVYKRMVAYRGVNKYVIIGIYGGTGISGMTLSQLEAMELEFSKEFGLHYFNMRKYVTTHALSDAGITPTTADTTAIGLGKCPPSLLADTVHPNSAFSILIAKKVHEMLISQGV